MLGFALVLDLRSTTDFNEDTPCVKGRSTSQIQRNDTLPGVWRD